MSNEIVIYQIDKLTEQVEVRIENETVWISRLQIALLFERDVKTIGKQIGNVLKEKLAGLSLIARFATTASDGKTYQTEHDNLDIIISVGYRVKSKKGHSVSYLGKQYSKRLFTERVCYQQPNEPHGS